MRVTVVALSVVLFALLCCCQGTPARAPPLPRADSNASGEPPPASELDEAAVKAMSRALLDAFDRADEPAFRASLGGAFGFLQNGRWLTADAVIGDIRQRRERRAQQRSRTYKEERVKVSSSSAVYVVDAVDHFLPDGDRPKSDAEGWSTLIWVREGASWKAVHWQWERLVDAEGERQMWSAIYRSGRGFNPDPNAFLAQVVKGRKPGAALDVAMGQGRNALFLAAQGWKVTGFDTSEDGLRIARQSASERKLSVDAINARDEDWDFGTARWELIAFIYAADADLLRRAIPGVKPGGLVVVEGFHKDAVRRAQAPGFATGEIASIFSDGFTVLRDEVVDDLPDWGDTRTKLVRFAAQKR